MEDTLGKRIAAHRRRLGLTQDRLAELLGVTAQAVSKWENDQSCPDISLLPKLSQVFGCTTDELLGIQKETVKEAELVASPSGETKGKNADSEDKKSFAAVELEFNPGKKTSILLALWILLTAGLLLMPNTELWSLLWRTGLLMFGIGGLWPHFSVFHLACALFGGYTIANYLRLFPEIFNQDLSGLLLPAWLLLFGLYLLVEALRKPGKRHRGRRGHHGITRTNRFDLDEETFLCETSFVENHHRIDLPRLSGGTADVSFGSLSVDLSGCESVAENCTLDLNCSFGELELLIPRIYQAVPDSDTAFGNVEIIGAPLPNPQGTITVRSSVSFGEISPHYI